MSETATRPRYVGGVEQAKLIRAALKEAFPGVKFSVRQGIRVEWVDGPRSGAVQEVCDRFRGGGFDGMQDLRYSVTQVLDGETVQYTTDFIICSREISDEWRAEIVDLISELAGVPLPTDWKGIHAVGKTQVAYARDYGLVVMSLERDAAYLQDTIHQYTAAHDRTEA